MNKDIANHVVNKVTYYTNLGNELNKIINLIYDFYFCLILDKTTNKENSQVKENDDSSSKRESLLKMDKYKEILKEIDINKNLLTTKNNLIEEIHLSTQNTLKPWRIYFPSNIKNIGVKFKDEGDNKAFTSLKIDKLSTSYETKKNHEISSGNITNMRICFIQTFLYMFNLTIVIPTNFLYIEKLAYTPILSGIILTLAPVGSLLSSMFISRFFKKSFKVPLLVSCFFLIIGNLLYSISENLESIAPMIMGRFILGLGCTRQLSRQYIINFIPNNYTSKYFFQYLLYSSLGLALGKSTLSQ